MARRDYYNDSEAPKPNSIVPAVTVVVVNDNHEVLLVHRVDNGRWALPGGGVELGEDVATTGVREVAEETGILVEITGLVGVYSDPRHVIAYDDGEVRQQFAISLRARPRDGELRASNESTEVAWVKADDLDTLDVHPSMRLRIDHGLSRPGSEPYVG
jgi:8-oxo-dGTP pyrophosphatase MutT (NUDIX family)